MVEKLKELGYNQGLSARRNFVDSLQTTWNSMGGNVYGFLSIPSDKIEEPIIDDINGVNCGTNEDLFLAIAALRDDSDIHQLFTDGEKWVISDIHSLLGMKEYFKMIGFNYKTTHKATVEELIKHFSV